MPRKYKSTFISKKIYIKDLEIITNNTNDVLSKNLQCQIRHLGEKYLCVIKNINNNLYVVMSEKPIRAPAQGQSLVIYDENICLGGGIITNGKN